MAATINYLYNVAACCDSRLNGSFTSTTNLTTGTFTYTGSTYTDPTNNFEWVNGACYLIIKIGVGSTTAILPNANLTVVAGDCLTAPCPCASDNRYLIFQNCCDNSLIYFKSAQDASYYFGLREYIGAPNYVLENTCYRVDIVSVGIGPIVNNTMWNALPLAPNNSSFEIKSSSLVIDCDDTGFKTECPNCIERCFMLTTCNGDIIYTNTNLSLYVGQFITINDQDNNPIVGTWYVIETDAPCDPESFFSSLQITGSNLQPDCPNECYEVTGTPTIIIYVDQDQATQELLGPGKFCSIVPPIVMGGTGVVTNYGNCVDNECPELCYIFTNCITSETLTVVSNTPNISQYASQDKVVTLNGYDGCWTIESNNGSGCECIDISFTYNSANYAYSIDKSGTRNGKNEYVSERGEIYWYEDGYWICNLFFDGFESYNRSLTNTDCPALNNWSNTDPVEVENLVTSVGNCCCVKVSYSYQDVDYTYNVPLSDTVIPIGGFKNDYYLDLEDGYFIQIVWIESGVWLLDINTPNGAAQLVNVTDSDCPKFPSWEVIEGDEFLNTVTSDCDSVPCDCPVNVTILQVFDDCPSCLPTIAYKFTNCNNQAIIKYSTDDYSAYVGKTVELDCGECWFVTQIDFVPPATQPINILFTFDSCLACNRTYYKLIDCLDQNNIIYTYTDLSTYIDDVLKIKGCNSCFTVEETREPVNAGIVEVTDSYIDCPECLETFPCVCSRITNQDTVTKNFTYINCLFEEVNITLAANETSDKVCLSSWVLTPEEEALVYIEHFGDCINGQCPVEPLPKRKVKPGYSTPSCDIEKYEKITCKSSEIYYKQVMRLRYGISNCCPEDEEKWLIKKELIDLQALIDPDYICKPVTTCCNQHINSCGCDCNQTIKTCNSQ